MNQKEVKPLVVEDLEIALIRLENFAKQYVREGSDLEDRKKRKKEMIDLIENMTRQIIISPDCPYGTYWDPITGTCK